MTILPSELTLIELCQALNVTPSWVNKAIRDFNLPREGRGRLRKYTRAEAHILQNAKLLLQLGCSLQYLKDLQKEEFSSRGLILNNIKRIEKEAKEGKIMIKKGQKVRIDFLINDSVYTDLESYTIKNKKDGTDVWINFEEWVKNTQLFPNSSTSEYQVDLSGRIKRICLDMNNFEKHLKYLYKVKLDI